MKLENEFLVWSLKVLNVVFCKRQREGGTYNIQILLNAHSNGLERTQEISSLSNTVKCLCSINRARGPRWAIHSSSRFFLSVCGRTGQHNPGQWEVRFQGWEGCWETSPVPWLLQPSQSCSEIPPPINL